MNNIPDSISEAIHDPAGFSASIAPQLEKLVRENPTTALLAAVGIGCAVGILSRSLLHSPPPPPRSRAQQVLEDIQSRLADLVQPAYKHATHLAEDGTTAVRKGLNSLHDLPVGRRLKNLFNC